MDDVYYSTGQTARELGVTQAKVRALCESGAIESTCTAGGQRRISTAEVERLRSEGLPSIPRPLPDQDREAVKNKAGRSRHTEAALLDEPSEAVIDSAEEVVCLENEVKSIGLKRQKEEALDWFRERVEKGVQQLTERRAADQERRNREAAERQRQAWEEKWLKYALDSIPREVPQALRTEAYRAAQEALTQLGGMRGESITRQLVDAAVHRGLAVWLKAKELATAVEKACDSAPWTMRHDKAWRARMVETASAAIARLQSGASAAQLQLVTSQAVAPLIAEFEHRDVCSRMVAEVWKLLPSYKTEELDEGKEVVWRALSEVKVGTSRREIERIRDAALEPTRAAISRRLDREMRSGVLQYVEFRLIGLADSLKKEALTAIAGALNGLPAGTSKFELERAKEAVIDQYRQKQQRLEQKQRLIEGGVRQIQIYLNKLSAEWEFDKSTFALARELEKPIRAGLEQELRGDEDSEEVDNRVRRLVRRELEI